MRDVGVRTVNIKEGVAAGLPIVIGYLPIALAFGILAKTVGVTLLDCFLFSAIVFAGASQFMALNLIGIGAGNSEIILATLLVNFRHFLMSSSLAARLDAGMKKFFPIIAFGVTDETFAVVSFRQGKVTKEFILSLQVVSYLSWVSGSVLGFWLGGLLPAVLKDSMAVALYAMFAALLIPEMKKSRKVLILALSSGAVNALLNISGILPGSWCMVATIVLVSAVGAYLFKGEDAEAQGGLENEQ